MIGRIEPMSTKTSLAPDPQSVDQTEVRALYRQLLNGWNQRNAQAIAGLFTREGEAIGFDGSELKGQSDIGSVHRRIFEDQDTGVFVGKVRRVLFLTPEVAVLSSVAGMVMPGHADLEPDLNAIQRLIAVKRDDEWRIAVFQNTPAQFHQRPEEARSLTEELRKLL
jgi:uncharacterized protein (TIGR02246 family)